MYTRIPLGPMPGTGFDPSPRTEERHSRKGYPGTMRLNVNRFAVSLPH